MGDEDAPQHWRQFQGTELGGLLSSIYGSQRRTIKYPVPKKASFDPAAVKFRPVNSTLNSTDATKATRKAVAVNVPKHFGRTESKENVFAPIPSRRSEEVIRAELEEISMRQRNYRPAYQQPRGEEEKERLSQICMYKGGKGLPIVLPVGETPLEVAAKAAMQKKNDAFLQQRRLARGDKRATDAALAVLKHGHGHGHGQPSMSVDERMAEQIKSELDERVAHLAEMQALGISRAEEAGLRAEIGARIEEMRRLGV